MIDLRSNQTALEYYLNQIKENQTDPSKHHRIDTILQLLRESGICPLHNPDLKPS